MPKLLSYTIRFPGELRTSELPSFYRPEDLNWQTDVLFGADGYTIKHVNEDDAGPPSYYKEGFLAIQNAVAKAFVAMKNTTLPEIQMRRFPTPKHVINIFASEFQVLMPLFFLMSLNYTFMNTVRFISIEKEKQLKEAMKIMGLASWMHYLSWFVRTLIMLATSMLLITILLTVNLDLNNEKKMRISFDFSFFFLCLTFKFQLFAETMVWSTIGHFPKFEFLLPVHLFARLLHLLDNIRLCDLFIFHEIKIGDDGLNNYLVRDICPIFSHVRTIRSPGRMDQGAAMLLSEYGNVVWL